MATPNYDINYEDERFKDVEAQKQAALGEVDSTYDGMINQSDKFYQDQIEASKQYSEQQQKNQQEQTDFLIDKIEQQKEQTRKDYLKEQKGAYVDWQKQSNQYGANAEQMAASGLTNTGYSESSQVSMYNTYQNRVGTARESYNRAVQDYDNNIKEAILQNNSVLADLAYQALQQQLELSLQGFQYKNDLLQTKLQTRQNTEDRYYTRWQDVLSQMNQENQLKESMRQYEENMSYQRERDRIADEQWQKQMEYQKQRDAIEDAQWQKQYNLSKSSYSNSSNSSGSTESSNSSTINKNNNSGSTTNVGEIKLSNGQIAYTDALEAYRKAGGKSPYSAKGVIDKGYVKAYKYNGVTYYYATREWSR